MKRLFLLLLASGALATAGTAKAAVYYVDTTGVESDSLIATVAQAKANPEIDTIYVAIGLYKMNTELIVEDVIFGGCTFGSNNSVTREYPGAVGNNRNRMTILDGNSFVLSLPSQKHRVATINSGGIIDGCLIRNGHARGTTNNPNDTKGFGGGVLINTGGRLHNSIVRGNVAMNLQFSKTNPSYGGGVYVNGGDVANCIIAFNLDDMGLGIGGSSGTILNNTIARNANAPRFVLISGTIGGTPFLHYRSTLQYDPPTTDLTLPYIHLDSFYMAATETTQGQYACFLAAIDLASDFSAVDWTEMCSAKTPMYGYSGIPISKYLRISTASVKLGNINNGLGLNGTVGSGNDVYYPLKATSSYAAGTSGGVSYPADPLVRDNFPMGYVNFFGSLAFCVWIGGMLPTEAQWEYAARKKADGSVQVSAAYAGGYTDVNSVAWYQSNSISSSGLVYLPHEVATLLPTELGIYDMCGNQCEWVADKFCGMNYATGPSIGPTEIAWEYKIFMGTVAGASGNTASEAIHNPIYNGPDGGYGVVRGGSSFGPVHHLSLSLRYNNWAGYNTVTPYDGMLSYNGFRCAACTGL